MDIVRNGEVEATNYFYGVPGQEEELEFTYNHDGRTYELGTAYGHVAFAVQDLDDTLAQLEEQGIEPEREPYRVLRIAFRRARLFEDYGWYFAKARTALWPPKPKLLLRATSTWWLRARLGM